MVKNNSGADWHPRRCDRVSGLELVSDLARDLDTRIGRAVSRALREDRHADYLEIVVDPSTYDNPDVFYRDWLAVNILRKSPELDLGIDTKEVAYQAFRQAELKCREVNARLRGAIVVSHINGINTEVLIHRIRRIISSLIGEAPNLDAIAKAASFSSGASTQYTRLRGDAFYKLSGRIQVTRQAALAAICLVTTDPIWSRELRRQYGCNPYDWFEIVDGNRVTTVPKNARTDRTIAIEAEANMLLQKGTGSVIRKALKRVGIDLDDQSINQVLAWIGSQYGTLATLDLKAASDTIAMAVVELLLPKGWVDWLCLIRSEVGLLPDGSTVTYEKISSMGNGFTFELESLIFWAICKGVVESLPKAGEDGHLVGIYGDDIIVPTGAAGSVTEVLQFFGFALNTDKSFVSGPFRESCGKHYFNGVDVTPFSIDYSIKTHSDLFLYANSIRRWAARQTDGAVCDPRWRRAYDVAVSYIPSTLQIIIPDDAGDRNGLIGTLAEFSQATSRKPKKKSKSAVWYYSLAERSSSIGIICGTAYARALMLGEKGNADMSQMLALFVSDDTDGCNRPSWEDTQHSRVNGGWNHLLLRQRRTSRRLERRSTFRWADPCYWGSSL